MDPPPSSLAKTADAALLGSPHAKRVAAACRPLGLHKFLQDVALPHVGDRDCLLVRS
jgi:hypothetical protein